MIKSQINNCSICQWIENIKSGKDPFFVLELRTGYVVIGHYQYFPGYTLFLCKKHVSELHELPKTFRQQFLNDMSITAEAVFRAFKPKKLNYELLGNTTSHLHWHIFPRYKNDPLPERPIWCVDRSITMNKSVKPSENELQLLKTKLLGAIKRL